MPTCCPLLGVVMVSGGDAAAADYERCHHSPGRRAGEPEAVHARGVFADETCNRRQSVVERGPGAR